MNATYKSLLDMPKLYQASLTLNYWLDGAGVEMSITQSGGLPEPAISLFREAIDEIAKVRIGLIPMHIMVNRLPPNTSVPIHIDPVIPRDVHLERWHLPIKTNDRAFWWGQNTGKFHMALGCWYGPMPYWELHNVDNTHPIDDRVHLIVDLK